MAYGQVIEALADPTRRALFERLRTRERSVGDLADFAGIRQPTVSQHLAVLRGARLVSDRRDGTRRYYRASREGLDELRRYVASFWDDVLAAFAAEDANPPASRRRTRGKGAR